MQSGLLYLSFDKSISNLKASVVFFVCFFLCVCVCVCVCVFFFFFFCCCFFCVCVLLLLFFSVMFFEIPLFHANSEDPDHRPRYAAFCLGLHCLLLSLLWDARLKWVKGEQ